jgi:murein DD-endopeptidase MepM/ murein hydrolase activator NlpD
MESARLLMKLFPVDLTAKPKPSYAQAFGKSHHGTDIFAPRGTAVFAVDDGSVRQADDPKGGTVAYLTTKDGTKYYYAHLDEFVGLSPRLVKSGDVIGKVGNTGNAVGKATHLHFQVSLPGQGTVDPFPLLKDVEGSSPSSPSRGNALPPLVAPLPPRDSDLPEPWG